MPHIFNCRNEFLKLLTSYKSTSHIFFLSKFFFSWNMFMFEVWFSNKFDNELLIANHQRKILFQCNGNHLYGIVQNVYTDTSKIMGALRCQWEREKKCVTHIFQCWTSIFDHCHPMVPSDRRNRQVLFIVNASAFVAQQFSW